jgi:hypothetical protein
MEVASIVIAAIGAAIVLVSMVQIFKRRIKAGPADLIVVKLAQARHPERIKKLAAAAPNTYLDVYLHAVQAAQTATATDAVTIAALTHPAFDRRGAELDRSWRAISFRGLVGAVLGGAGLYLGYSNHFTPQHLRALGGLSALAGVWFLFHLGDVARDLKIGREDVLPEVDRAFTASPLESSE